VTSPTQEVRFGPYRLDLAHGRLWKTKEPVALQPKPLAVLGYLAARPGEVVGRDELIRTLWAGTYVTKAVLKVAVRAIREALGDDAGTPRYVETVGREGYRFIGTSAAAPRRSSRDLPAPTAPPIVGREHELELLRAHLGQALAERRTTVFVTGEAGIGKTTLIDRFIEGIEHETSVWVARGQCLEQYGEGEAYLPVLEALGGLLRADPAGELADVLRQCAPAWLPLLPAIETGEVAERPDGPTAAPRPARMLREFADALDLFTRRHALVLVLEDLQWSDPSTVDLIARVASRRDPARLLVVGTFRPADVIVHEHRLHTVEQDLLANGLCEALRLEFLSLADVTAYVGARFGIRSAEETGRIAALVHEHSEGNALFMVNVVNDLVARGVLVRRDREWRIEGRLDRVTEWIPTGLHELLGRRMQRLPPPARRVLDAASVAGDEFAVAGVAAALGDDPDAVEDVCETLAAQGVLIAETGIAEWPDGSLSGRYRFLHALYRRVLYDGISEARRIRLHRAIGLREEAGFGQRVGERAAELAMHFERGRDHARALEYHSVAARMALDRHAAHEAVAHFTAALDALTRVPDGANRRERELSLVVSIATMLMAVKGYAAPDTERAFARARALCDAMPESPNLHPVLRGLVSYHHVRAEFDEAHGLGELLLQRSAALPHDRILRVQAFYGHGATLFHMGRFDEARRHLEAALHDYDPATYREHLMVYGGYDPGVACSMWLAWTLTLQGRLDEAAEYDRQGLAIARRHADVFSLAWAHYAAGTTQQLFGDWGAAERASAEAVALAEEHGFPYVLGMALANRGWALVMQGHTSPGIQLVREGVATVAATGARLVRPSYLAMLAAADAIEGNRDSAAQHYDEALAEVERTGERLHEAGLLIGRTQVLAFGRGPASESEMAETESYLRKAHAVAVAQGARLFELRASLALARLSSARGCADAERVLVEQAYACFAGTRIAAPEVVGAIQLLAGDRG
jgi:DNA-binding winged helix-turn-helix (wHTH) protein/tetratricopeptide (TPR) repeat protein